MTSPDNRKLSFFYTYKKVFQFEKYLDAVPRPIRMFTTRLRTSSHNYPIEVLRYKKQNQKKPKTDEEDRKCTTNQNKPKIDREDRKCTICNENQIGDEIHYLLKCTNHNISNIRKTHMEELRKTIDQFDKFSEENMVKYCLLMNDERTLNGMTKYIKAVAEAYKEELMESPINQTTTTRCGRLVKKPNKLNL